jgi:hypothetical protein
MAPTFPGDSLRHFLPILPRLIKGNKGNKAERVLLMPATCGGARKARAIARRWHERLEHEARE